MGRISFWPISVNRVLKHPPEVGLSAMSSVNRIIVIAVPVVALMGCSRPEASFVYNERTESLPKLAQVGGEGPDGTQVRGIKTVIEEQFGTPQELVAWLTLPIDYGVPGEEAEGLDGKVFQFPRSAVDSQQPGYKFVQGRSLYMQHCLHCHGTSGDGAGPTAEYLNPRPRDYRKGLFKFTSTREGERISRDDLRRIIKFGIPGTYMPSFLLLSDEDVAVIGEYVRWLAIRGELEYALGAQFVSDFSEEAIRERVAGGETRAEITAELAESLAELPDMVAETAEELAEAWARANTRRKGRAIFISAAAKCTNCHGPHGLGNGRQTEEFETNDETGKKWPEPGLHDKWGNIVKPRNLTAGIYRGGRRPIDLFRRVRAGIKGSAMPAFGESVISDENLWHLINYVKSIPFGPTVPAPASEVFEKTEAAG